MRRSLLIVLVGIGVLASLAVLAQRWVVEARNNQVEIVLDGPDWEGLALREGRDPTEFLAAAHTRGATSIALYERTLKRMAAAGDVIYLSSGQLLAEARLRPFAPFQDLAARGQVRPQAVYITGSPEILAFVDVAFRGVLGSDRVRRLGPVLEVSGLTSDLEELGLGFLPRDFERYRRIGLVPVVRLRNYPGLTAEGLRHRIERLARLGRGGTVVFELQEVLGFERLIDETAAALRDAGYRYGRIEVFNVKRKQRGEELLAGRMRPEVIRLFSLTPEELLAQSPASVVDKFVRAARERNVRLLYLRPLVPGAGVVGTESNLAYLSTMSADLKRFGLRPARAEPLPEIHVSRMLLALVAAGSLAAIGLGVVMLGDAVGAPVPLPWIWLGVLGGLLITAGTMVGGYFALWRKLLALGTAAVVPAVAAAVALPRRGGRPVRGGLRALWVAAIGSVAGGLLVGAILTEWNFMMAADVFLGVKVAQVIPIVVVVLLVWRRDRPPRDWREAVREIWGWSSRPLLLRYAIVAVIAATAAVILLARSGNFGLPLLGVEERLRTVTEDLLIARPRTKEYLIGHPALLMAAAAAAAGRGTWVLPLAAIGVIGQAGIVNSFSHIHTPLLYASLRTVSALLLGSVAGIIGAAVLLTLLSRFGRSLRRGVG